MTKHDLDTKNIFLIMPDDMVKKYRRRLLQEGFICKAVDSGFYALTMLEREKPNLIIATEDIEDLEIHDLIEIIDDDPDLVETRIIVLSENLDAHNNDRCVTLDRESDFETILTTVHQLLSVETSAEASVKTEEITEVVPEGTTESASHFNDQNVEETTNEITIDETLADGDNIVSGDTIVTNNPVNQHSSSADIRFDTSDAQISGELATNQLEELIKTFAMGSRGLLIVRAAKADGRLLLAHDRLLKAEYNNTEGQEAFNELLYDVLSEPKISYFFKRYETEATSQVSKSKGVDLSYLLKISDDLIKTRFDRTI